MMEQMFALFLTLGVGHQAMRSDINKELPARYNLELQLMSSKDDSATLSISIDHVSDAAYGSDYGQTNAFVQLRAKIF